MSLSGPLGNVLQDAEAEVGGPVRVVEGFGGLFAIGVRWTGVHCQMGALQEAPSSENGSWCKVVAFIETQPALGAEGLQGGPASCRPAIRLFWLLLHLQEAERGTLRVGED
jgi:hypothetical protein